MEADREHCNAVAVQRGTCLFHMATIVFFRPPQMTDIRHVEAGLIPSPIVLDSSCAGLTRASIEKKRLVQADGLPGQARQ
jgi:hypothetical protein